MVIRFKGLKVIGILGISFLLATSCNVFKKKSSDDDSTSVQSIITNVEEAIVTASDKELVLSAKLNLIPPKEGGSGLRLVDLVDTYDSDETSVWVEEDSLESLSQAETILCYISQTRFETQVNAGSYMAVVDESKCENSKHDEKQGQSLLNMKVIVEREENRPLIAKGWIQEEKDGVKEDIDWVLAVAEGSSSQNPLGIFKFNFTFSANGTESGGGTIEASRSIADNSVILRFYTDENKQNHKYLAAANALLKVDANGNITGGKVTTHMESSGEESHGPYSQQAEYKVDFNDSLLKKEGSMKSSWEGESSGTACINRNEFDTIIYRYGLYNADGTRKNLNSGFPIEFEKDGKKLHGHVSYWGIWTEGDVSLDNGQAITKVDWSSGDKKEEAYTVIKAPGKLYKYTKSSIKLGELKGVDIQYHEWDQSTSQSTNYIVNWDGSNFVKVSKVTYSNNGETKEAASGVVTKPEWGYNFWINSLSASINIPSDATLSDNLELYFHSEELVSGKVSSDLTLKCFSRCPKMQATYDSSSDNWGYKSYPSNKQEWDMRVSDGALATYTFKASDKNLYEGSTAYQIPSGQDAWIDSGVLVTDTQLGSNSSANISPWELESKLDEFYRFRSSSNSWGQYYAAKDANGQIAVFDRPLEFTYTHSLENDYDGKTGHSAYNQKFRIEYGGFGELWGIPWEKKDGAEREKPLFSMKTGTKLTHSDGSVYTVKALEGGQKPVEVDMSQCDSAGLSLADIPKLPDASLVQTVDNGEPPADADSPIRVIEGEVLVE